MLTLGRQAQASAAVFACVACVGVVVWIERLTQAADAAATIWLWLGLAVCTAFALPLFGKGLYDPKQPLREVLRSLIYDSAEDDVVERKRMPADLAAKQLVKSPVPAASYASSAQRKTKGTAEIGPTEDAIIVVGSGIAGLSAAASLHKVGFKVLVLEREPAPRHEGSAITFWPNAFRVLDALGVAAPVRSTHPLVHRVEINDWDGSVLRSFALDECEHAPHDARIVRRATLLAALRSAVPEHLIHYGVHIADVHAQPQGAEVELVNGERLRCKAVIGCDGAKSFIAAKLGLKPAAYCGEVYYRGIATFPEGVPEPPGTLRMIWSSRGVRVGISSISDTQCFWFTTLTCPEEAKMETPEKRKEDALNSVRGFAYHIQDAIRHTPAENVTRSRIVDRWLKPNTEFGQGCITLGGDALHPMTPALGQGGCIALEDGVKLAQALVAAGGTTASAAEIAAALRGYERERTARSAPVIVKSWIMGAQLRIRGGPWAFVRNWFMRLAYPVHSFLKPAAFWPGSLEPGSAIRAAQPQKLEILPAVNAMLVQPQAVAVA